MFFGVFWILYPGKLVNFPLKEWVRTSNDGKFGNILGNAAAEQPTTGKAGNILDSPFPDTPCFLLIGEGKGGGLDGEGLPVI
jgi:hypothetical protein